MVFLIAIVIMMPDSKRVIINKRTNENRGSRYYELVSCVEINASISNRVTLLRCIR